MVRRYYITGGNNVGDPAVGDTSITDPYFEGKEITGVFKEGFRYYVPGVEWVIDEDNEAVLKIIDQPDFTLNEVIAVEVSVRGSGETGDDSYSEYSSEVDPYLPDIIRLAVARVNSVFENREDDPFSVYYDHGLYEQVGSDRLRSDKGYLFVWLVMPFIEQSAADPSYFADATCKIIIAIKTDNNYTQLQREDINFHPRLLPVYKQLIKELKAEIKLENGDKIDHTRRLLPYWGGGDMMSPGQANLWKDNVDAIELSNIKLKIGYFKYCTFTSNF